MRLRLGRSQGAEQCWAALVGVARGHREFQGARGMQREHAAHGGERAVHTRAQGPIVVELQLGGGAEQHVSVAHVERHLAAGHAVPECGRQVAARRASDTVCAFVALEFELRACAACKDFSKSAFCSA